MEDAASAADDSPDISEPKNRIKDPFKTHSQDKKVSLKNLSSLRMHIYLNFKLESKILNFEIKFNGKRETMKSRK